ncbi:restriction endonuclease subunit S [Vibrio alginolyticus]|uniref:restriction endonuclease subunit S n=1 Tax=Vibrio TaxID=662 RepID=UPI001BAFB041|nr:MULTISPECIES: restriction endonuclease subunit S [Vibrio]EGR2699515.1 restriction endonuclease subunit S [Vibrio parahaemolyticus]MCQ9070211.1 restriction endonuclease subunit S [Vibrio alginolyticus]MCR9638296.1 restriction endonuclease subunit S [Vibrio alginolyticus]MDF4568603.1 restriction endonuclease subunit S [Vibrio parahaemolyticus]MDF4960566.1 restriction endonuclease subunit S [Vibrio parahaemolyticus]
MNSPIWKSVPLSSCIDKVIDFRGKTPKKIGMEWGNGSIRALSANNVKQGYIDFKRECYLASEELYDAWMTKGDCSKGDIVFTMEAPLGNVALIPDDNKYILSQRVILLKPNESVLSEYLFHFMSSESFQNELNANATGSTAKGIKQTRLVKLKVTLPPAEEQQKIAEVLSTVDKKIDLIDQKIAETEKLKTGLMQKLFSEGVGVQDENGDWQPHTEFQDSPFGKIPKCWQPEILGNILDVASSKRIKREEYVDEGVPFYRSKEIIQKSKHLSFTPEIFISRERFDKISEKFGSPQKGDILISAVGTIGAIYCVQNEEFYFKDGNLLWLRGIDKSELSSEFLECYLRSHTCQEMLANLSAGSSQSALTIVKLNKLPLIIPTEDEQKMIVSIISSVSKKINLLKAQKHENQLLKKGLMQKLLTGEWRVPVEETEAA